MPETTSESSRAQVEALRRKLLDLSLRNRMLNYRPSKRLGITIVGEDAREVYRLLVTEGKKMTFAGRPTPPVARTNPGQPPQLAAELADAAPAASEPDGEPHTASAPVDPSDTKLNTDEPAATVDPKLRTIQREAQFANDELGRQHALSHVGHPRMERNRPAHPARAAHLRPRNARTAGERHNAPRA